MIEVIQGERQRFLIDLASKKTKKPFDLTGNDDIEVCFKAGTTLIVKKRTLTEVTIIGDPLLGQIEVFLTKDETPTLPPVTDGITVTTILFPGDDVKKAIELDAFMVIADPCNPT